MTEFYTCTMNTAIDLWIETDQLQPNTVNRSRQDDIYPNGKGVNVSLILKQMGIDNIALGFASGFTGEFIEKSLQDLGVKTDFIKTNGMTRINVFTKVNQTQEEFKLVNQGPEISLSEQQNLLDKISQIPKASFLIVSGSLPRGVSPIIFKKIAKICHQNGVRLVVDTSYEAVLDVLPYTPYLLKPNEEELAHWFGKEVIARDEAITLSQELINRGAENILLSLGGEGAIFINKSVTIQGSAPKISVVNTACAGDTLLGTFIGCFSQTSDPALALQQAIAAGSSTASQSGLTDLTDVPYLLPQVKIQQQIRDDARPVTIRNKHLESEI